MDPMDNNIINNSVVNSDPVSKESNNNGDSVTYKKNNKKIIITVFSLLFLAVSVGVGVLMIEHPTQKTGVNAAGANLVLTTNNASPNVNDTVVVAVSMDTQGLNVTGLDLTLKYDSNYLTPTGIAAGPFLPYVFIGGTTSGGLAKIVLGCPIDNSGAHPVTGSGLTAQVTFTVKAPGATTVTIDSSTKVSASGQTTNMIGTLTPVQITGVVPTPSPTPPPGCHYQQVQCIQAPCNPILVCTTSSPTPNVVGCNQTCGLAIQGNVCSTGLTCYAPDNPNGGISATGLCRKPTCTSSTNCNCGNPTPTPVTIMCGGIQGLLCPAGKVCIYSDGSTKAPYPDASGTCQTATPKPTSTYSPTTLPSHSPSPTPNKPGDINHDGIVNIVDIGIIIDNYGMSPLSDKRADINNDGIANIIDIGIVIDNYEQSPAFCGGISGVMCTTGVCMYTVGTVRTPVAPYPDASGTCEAGSLKPTPTPLAVP